MNSQLQRFWRFAFRGDAVRSTGGAAAAELLRITAGLSDDTRRVVTLHKVYELNTPDIAARLGLTARAVENHLVIAALAFWSAEGETRP
jgi:DNA-directed RNA polymerase specialized sigma24 family protein